MGSLARFKQGIGFFKQGAKLAYSGKRLAFSLPPLAINIGVFCLGAWFVIEKGGALADWLVTPDKGEVSSWLNALVAGVARIVLLYLVVTLWPIVAAVVAAPFLEFLTDEVERHAHGTSSSQPFSLRGMLQDLWAVISHAMKGFALFFGLSLAAGLLEAVPGVGPILHVIAAASLSGLYLSLQFTDYPAARRRLGFFAKLKVLWKDLAGYSGFGMMLLLAFFIPVTAPFSLAPAASGGTLLFLDAFESKERAVQMPKMKKNTSTD